MDTGVATADGALIFNGAVTGVDAVSSLVQFATTANVPAMQSTLYRINLTTGVATSLGVIGPTTVRSVVTAMTLLLQPPRREVLVCATFSRTMMRTIIASHRLRCLWNIFRRISIFYPPAVTALQPEISE